MTGAQCGNPARWDLCGGPSARTVPTATIGAGPLFPLGGHLVRGLLSTRAEGVPHAAHGGVTTIWYGHAGLA